MFRLAVFLVPAGTFLVTRKLCRDLRDSGLHPIRGMATHEIARDGSGQLLDTDEDEPDDDEPTDDLSPSPPRGRSR